MTPSVGSPLRCCALVLALVLIAGACTGSDESATSDAVEAVDATVAPDDAVEPTPVAGGTVRVGLPGEPDGLNPWSPASSDAAVSIAQTVLAPLSRRLPDGTFEPWLLAAQPQMSSGDPAAPFAVVYDLRDDATWSDGQPIDARDVLFTLAKCQQLHQADATPGPCAAADLGRSSADGTRATVTFDRPVAGWREPLGGLPVLPEHLLRDADITTAWRDSLPIASGPFRFASWTPGARVVVTRNDRWWGPPVRLDRLEFVFGDTIGVADVLRGDIDVLTANAALDDLERARTHDGVRVTVGPGAGWTALDFNLASPRLARADVRRALATALNKEVIVDELLGPILPAATPRDGLLVDEQAAAQPLPTPTPDSEAAGLDQAGCTRGIDRIYVCDDEPLTLVLTTDDRDPQHRIVGEYVRAQLTGAGVDVQTAPDTRDNDAAEAVGWDLRVASIAASEPGQIGERWRCEATANTQAYCNPELDTLLTRAAGTVEQPERDAVYLEAESLLSRDRPTVPLYVGPQMLVYVDDVRGPTLAPGSGGVSWDAGQWARTATAATRP